MAFTTNRLRELQSATQYPEIKTYHAIDSNNEDPKLRGTLIENAAPLPFEDMTYGTEKIDGANVRVIIDEFGDVIIGGRHELLWALNDRIYNNKQGIVEFLQGNETFKKLVAAGSMLKGKITVYYMEYYGHRELPNSKQYTNTKTPGIRIFDVQLLDPEVLYWPVENIASWRDNGHQVFLPARDLAYHFDSAMLVPYMFAGKANGIDSLSIAQMHELLTNLLPKTEAGLDHIGKAEGLVIRDNERKLILKARIEDYEKHARKTKRG